MIICVRKSVNLSNLDSLNILYKHTYFLMDSIHQAIVSTIGNNVQSTLNINQALNVTTEYERNEKFLNRIVLNSLLNDTILVQDIDTLLALAATCINTIGLAAVRAQGLLPDSLSYYREPLMYCEEQQEIISSTKVSNQLNRLILYPNPTNGLISILDIDKELILQWKIFSVEGQLLSEITEKRIIDHMQIDLGFLQAGAYLIQIIDKHGNSKLNKIIKTTDQ